METGYICDIFNIANHRGQYGNYGRKSTRKDAFEAAMDICEKAGYEVIGITESQITIRAEVRI